MTLFEDLATSLVLQIKRKLYKVSSETKLRVNGELSTKFVLICESQLITLKVTYYKMGRKLVVKIDKSSGPSVFMITTSRTTMLSQLYVSSGALHHLKVIIISIIHIVHISTSLNIINYNSICC